MFAFVSHFLKHLPTKTHQHLNMNPIHAPGGKVWQGGCPPRPRPPAGWPAPGSAAPCCGQRCNSQYSGTQPRFLLIKTLTEKNLKKNEHVYFIGLKCKIAEAFQFEIPSY